MRENFLPAGQFAQRGYAHDLRIRLAANPQFELFNGLGYQHLKPAQRFASGQASLAQESGFRWIVNEIVSQSHPAKLFSAHRGFVLSGSLRPERRRIYHEIKSLEAGIGKRTTTNVKTLSQGFSFLQIARE